MSYLDDEGCIIEDLVLVAETPLAYLLRRDEDDQEWVPKSQILDIDFGESHDDEDGRPVKDVRSVEIPLWLARNLGWD